MNKLFAIFTFCFVLTGFVGFAPVALADDEGEGLSMSETSYTGARLLKGGENVQVGGIATGPYADEEDRDRYSYWQGDTHFAGVKNPVTGNKVDIVSEWYWFESSIPRNADFYVGVIKVKTSPNPVDDWYLKEENGWYGNIMWPDDVVQQLRVEMDPSGEWGGLRWDWCVPFDTYSWEPEQTTQVSSSYSAGFDLKGDAGAGIKPSFSEGGMLKDVKANANIQAKGYVSGDHKVSTQYTITLYKWQVLVSSGSDAMQWQMRILKDGNNQDSAYHEYFVVIQAEKGTDVWVPTMDFGANFKHSMWYWFDGYEVLSATLHDITFTPPPTCYIDDEVPGGVCETEGVCAAGAGYCDPVEGEWACNYPEEYEVDELTCDGLDNDCDGQVDEPFVKLGLSCDGPDEDLKKNGIYVCDPDGTGVVCDEDPCAGKECGDGCGECDWGTMCVNNKCIDPDAGEEENPEDDESFNCNGITEVGQCDGNWLLYCAGGEIVEQYCAFCCGFDAGKGYFDCLGEEKCEASDECIPECTGQECGPDGCGGVCGVCGDGETCSDAGICEWTDDSEEKLYNTCGVCPTGTICSATGECVANDSNLRPGASAEQGEGAQGCTASFGGNGSNGAFLLLALLALLALAMRRSTSRSVR